MGLNPAVEALRRKNLSRATAVAIIFTSVIAFVIFFALVVAPPVVSQGTQLINKAPQLLNDLTNNQVISKLNEQIAFFKEERERWALEKESLLAEKNRQDSINQTLNSRLDESKQTNDYLTSVTRDLTVEKSKLEKEKSSLAKKVDKASMIKADKISVKTLQKKDNGKNVSRKNH
jgi:predicted PurR-regulated permease PerM